METPRAFARDIGAGLAEYLGRALAPHAALSEPRDLAWLLASYARDGLARVEAAGDAPPLKAVRSALEEALGVRFEGKRGEAFFRSTLVQTLFYGLFSAWVLWARRAAPSDRFDWRTAVWHLRAPVLRALFHQLSGPGRLQGLDLVEAIVLPLAGDQSTGAPGPQIRALTVMAQAGPRHHRVPVAGPRHVAAADVPPRCRPPRRAP